MTDLIPSAFRPFVVDNKKNALCSDGNSKMDAEVLRVLSYLGKSVKITRPDLEGEVIEVIFCMQEVVFKVKCWINELPNCYTLEEREFEVIDK